MKPDPCCSAMADYNAKYNHHNVGFDFAQEGWALNGCCGGGCFVIWGMWFCPFCGKRLAAAADTPAIHTPGATHSKDAA